MDNSSNKLEERPDFTLTGSRVKYRQYGLFEVHPFQKASDGVTRDTTPDGQYIGYQPDMGDYLIKFSPYGKPEVVRMSPQEFDLWLETMHEVRKLAEPEKERSFLRRVLDLFSHDGYDI